MRIPPVLLALAAAAALASCDAAKPPAPPAKTGGRAYRVGTETVATRTLSHAVEAVGTVEAQDVVAVAARVPGTLESLSFDEGDRVTTDQVLAVVDGKRYALELDQAKATLGRGEASLDSARARSLQAQAGLDEALAALARRRGLREKNPDWVTPDEMSTLEGTVARARASREEAGAGEKVAAAQIAESRTTVAMAEKNAEDARVRSPIAGIIEKRQGTPGQYVHPGDPLAVLVDASRLRVRFRVSESESVLLRSGQVATFRVSAFPGRDLPAEIFHVNATADPVSRMVECVALAKDPPAGLRPGFFAAVSVAVTGAGEAVVVPLEAVLPTEKGYTAFVIEGGKARARTVRLGLHTKDGGVEVVEGLTRGETLAVAGAQTLQDGVAVEIVPAPGGGK